MEHKHLSVLLKRRWPSLMIGLVIAVVMVWLTFGYQQTGLKNSAGKTDLAVYYAAAEVVLGKTALTAGEIYQQAEFRPIVRKVYVDGVLYFYPPPAAVLLAPIALLQFASIVDIWMVMNVLLLIVTILIWLYLLKLSVTRRSCG